MPPAALAAWLLLADPLTADLARFPHWTEVEAAIARNKEAEREFIEAAFQLWRRNQPVPERLTWAKAECVRRYEVWHALDMMGRVALTPQLRRNFRDKLRRLLGEAAWKAGRMPAAVPDLSEL